MTISQLHINANTPLGANLIASGATFRTWAPEALEVYIALHTAKTKPNPLFDKSPDKLLKRDQQGYWSGFVEGVKDGDYYRFYIVGNAKEGFKRDPYARELEMDDYPNCDCIVRAPNTYPWHDSAFRTPQFEDLIIYQFHIGVFYAVDQNGND